MPEWYWRLFSSPVFLWTIFLTRTGLHHWEREQGASIELARTIAVNTLVMFGFFYLINSRYIKANVLNFDGLLGNRYALIAVGVLVVFQLCFTCLGPMQILFGTAAIDVMMWVRIVLIASSILFLVELEKAVIRCADRNRNR